MNPAQGALIQILRDLAAREARWYQEADLDPALRAIYAYLGATYPRCHEEEIQRFVTANPDRGTLHDWGGFIHLVPLRTREWAVPVLTFEYTWAEPSKVGLRLGLFLNSGENADVACIGYRFETPDLPGGENPFFHLQHIVELRAGQPLPTPPWIPQNKMAVPLDVKSEVGLLLCLLTSLYGADSEVLRQVMSAQYRTMLTTHVASLAWGPPAPGDARAGRA